MVISIGFREECEISVRYRDENTFSRPSTVWER